MRIAADRRRKGELKMYGLATEIRDLWVACGNVVAHPVPGGQLEIDSLNDVIVALDHALVSVRTLDLEVFAESDSGYEVIRNDLANRRGQIVRALTGPRNSAVHHADVVDPDVSSAVGPLSSLGDRYVITPRWKRRTDLPERMFQVKSKGVLLHQRSVADAYDATCAAVPLVDSLMDAFAFFDGLVPDLAPHNPDGSLQGFPLPPYGVATHYRRLAPDWPTEEEWNRQSGEE